MSAVRIPHLGLSVAVVPTAWEPPPFVVGELRGSANVTLGNTILVGHLGGAAGDVFKNLDQLQVGDHIVAVSRGLEYMFWVTEKQIRTADDSQPTLALNSARLTLMTCAGSWDPLTRNYSERLWVTAEPPQLAAETIAANAARPPTPVPPQSAIAPTAPTVAEAGDALGLGAERATVDRSLGPPLGETPGKLVVYRKASVEYHVRFTADPPRAELIGMSPLGGAGSLSIPTAVQHAHAQFPTDAAPRSRAPDGTPALVIERFASPALAGVFIDRAASGEPGDFVAAYARDASGAVTSVVIARGDDPRAALQDAAR